MPTENDAVRTEFPALDATLYLDAAHQAPLAASVHIAVEEYYHRALASAGPKSLWLNHIETVRLKLASMLRCMPGDIAFTKNTSEGLNIAAHGLSWNPGDNVALLYDEHPNNVYAWLAHRDHGLAVRAVRPQKQWADAADFAGIIDSRTRAISISHVMFHSGVRNDIGSIAELASSRGIPLVLDATQSVGILPLSLDTGQASIIVAGCHKGLLTPHGLGFLSTRCTSDVLRPTYVGAAAVANAGEVPIAFSNPVALQPDARRFDLGNYNIPAIYGLGAALDLIAAAGVPEIERHVLDLGEQLIESIKGTGVAISAPEPRCRRSHIYVLATNHFDLARTLAKANVRFSRVPGGVRISFGLYSTADDVAQLAAILSNAARTAP